MDSVTICSDAAASVQASDTARRILALRESHRLAVTDTVGHAAGNGHRMLEHLYEQPIVSVATVRGVTGTSYAASNNLVARLVDCGILEEFTGQARSRLFLRKDYVGLFDEPEGEA